MSLHLITITKTEKSQEDIHTYFKNQFEKCITQKEFHKSGKPHYHILVQSDKSEEDLKKIVNTINPPINQFTNNIRYNVSSVSGSYCYVTKDKSINKPLYHGWEEKQVNKIVCDYRKASLKENKDAFVKLENLAKDNYQNCWKTIQHYFVFPKKKYIQLIHEEVQPYEDEYLTFLREYDFQKHYANKLPYTIFYLHIYNPLHYVRLYQQLVWSEDVPVESSLQDVVEQEEKHGMIENIHQAS